MIKDEIDRRPLSIPDMLKSITSPLRNIKYLPVRMEMIADVSDKTKSYLNFSLGSRTPELSLNCYSKGMSFYFLTKN